MPIQDNCLHLITKRAMKKPLGAMHSISNFNIHIHESIIQFYKENKLAALLICIDLMKNKNINKTEKRVMKIQNMAIEMKRSLNKCELLRQKLKLTRTVPHVL